MYVPMNLPENLRSSACFQVLSWVCRHGECETTSCVVPSPLKKLMIGEVPNRGGVPEGFAVKEVSKDVAKANAALHAKDAPLKQVRNHAEPPAGSQRKREWNKEDDKSSAPSESRRRGGVYHGVTRGYIQEGRRPFPGYDAVAQTGVLHSDSCDLGQSRKAVSGE